MKTKMCKYCGKEFSKLDFPAQFARMVTCGDVECMGLRKLSRLKKNFGGKKMEEDIDWEEITDMKYF